MHPGGGGGGGGGYVMVNFQLPTFVPEPKYGEITNSLCAPGGGGGRVGDGQFPTSNYFS